MEKNPYRHDMRKLIDTCKNDIRYITFKHYKRWQLVWVSYFLLNYLIWTSCVQVQVDYETELMCVHAPSLV